MKLREWMDKRDISVMDLAYILGVSRGHTYNVLKGIKNPSKKLLDKISKFTYGEISSIEEVRESNEGNDG